MDDRINKLIDDLGLENSADKEAIERELKIIGEEGIYEPTPLHRRFDNIYSRTDMDILPGYPKYEPSPVMEVKTLEELLERDKKREEDGFPRRIRIGKYIKPGEGKKGQVVVVPTTTEPKFYHDDSVTEEEEDSTGGSGDGEEGEVIGQQPAQPQQGEGEGSGAGQGQGADHDISQDAFDLGKMLTEQFELPNLRDKGKKRSFTKYIYDLTDRNRGFGQVLDKKATMKQIIETNILLGRISKDKPIDTTNLLINPKDEIYRILSKEKDFENQAVVFFMRDYSGSMQGKPTEAVSQQHLFIYSWLMYQYQNMVETRFILHDTEPKEVEDFATYHRSQVAGGTKIGPAFELVNKIIENEQLARDYNIYVFHGTDGDDWESEGKQTIEEIRKMFSTVNRIGITVAKNSWGSMGQTTVEKYMERSGLLKERPDFIRLDSFAAESATEKRIIEGIKTLVKEK